MFNALPQDIRDEFDRVLVEVRALFPGSYPVIGGGAVRDALHGRPIKDVDVFLRKQDHASLDHVFTVKVPTNPFMERYGRKDMHGAWDLTACPFTGSRWPVQLILSDFENYMDLARTFDIGLSRATYAHGTDGAHLYVTNEFIQDSEDKAFRIHRAETDMELRRSQKRVERLLTKYPDFHAAV